MYYEFGTGFAWTSLGFYRGVSEYDYKLEQANKNLGVDKKPYIFSSKLNFGTIGAFIYGNPFSLPITINKELYRLEVNFRGLTDEKHRKEYNSIL
jgi:hypothetical protein